MLSKKLKNILGLNKGVEINRYKVFYFDKKDKIKQKYFRNPKEALSFFNKIDDNDVYLDSLLLNKNLKSK